jgi:hypothetical protein
MMQPDRPESSLGDIRRRNEKDTARTAQNWSWWPLMPEWFRLSPTGPEVIWVIFDAEMRQRQPDQRLEFEPTS